MLCIKITRESNGAHENPSTSTPYAMPDGYTIVREDLEQKALLLLPWVKIVVTDGVITAVEDDVVARKAWKALPKPVPPLDQITQMQLAIAELAEVGAQRDIENKLAIAELAEAMFSLAVPASAAAAPISNKFTAKEAIVVPFGIIDRVIDVNNWGAPNFSTAYTQIATGTATQSNNTYAVINIKNMNITGAT